MAKFVVTGEVTISCQIEVDARNAREARKLAEGSSMMSLCHSCSGPQDGAWSTSGELDGTPRVREVRAR